MFSVGLGVLVNRNPKAFRFFVCLTLFNTPGFLFASTQNLSMSLHQTQYVSDPTYEFQSNQYSHFLLGFDRQDRFLNNQFYYKADMNAVLPMNESSELHVYVPDLYAGRSFSFTNSRSLEVSVGRKQHTWSYMDEVWGVGIWQPKLRWDYVTPLPMGLTGLFMDFGRPGMNLTVFLSGLHLPDQHPPFTVDDGTIESSSRWFRAPISQVEVASGENDVFYEINNPSVSDVVFNPSIGFSFLGGSQEDGFWARASYANKPMNQFHVAIDTQDILKIAGDSVLKPSVNPLVIRHELTTLETGWTGDNNSFWMSQTLERFERPELPEGQEQTELIDGGYFSIGYSQRLHFLKMPQTRLNLGYLHRQDSLLTGQSLVIEGDIESSAQRLNFSKLYSVGLQTPFYPSRYEQLQASFTWTYSPIDRGEWVSADFIYQPDRRWSWQLGLDFFGSPKQPGKDTSFITSYKNNDRLRGSLSYVF